MAADLAPKRSISPEIGTKPAIVATLLGGVAAQVLAVGSIVLTDEGAGGARSRCRERLSQCRGKQAQPEDRGTLPHPCRQCRADLRGSGAGQATPGRRSGLVLQAVRALRRSRGGARQAITCRPSDPEDGCGEQGSAVGRQEESKRCDADVRRLLK